MSGCWLHLQTAGDFVSQLVMSGETAGILGETVVILGETAGILGRHLVKPQAVFGDVGLLLQHREPSYPDLAVNELLEELVDQPRLLELHGICWPPSLAFSGSTPAAGCRLCAPEPTLEWEDHHQMESQPTLKEESGKGEEGGEEEGRRKGTRCK